MTQPKPPPTEVVVHVQGDGVKYTSNNPRVRIAREPPPKKK